MIGVLWVGPWQRTSGHFTRVSYVPKLGNARPMTMWNIFLQKGWMATLLIKEDFYKEFIVRDERGKIKIEEMTKQFREGD